VSEIADLQGSSGSQGVKRALEDAASSAGKVGLPFPMKRNLPNYAFLHTAKAVADRAAIFSATF
jgi:hypothetical protein